ncbi:MAG: AraC family transcriptional regulator [Bacilli bacterium]|nr:AraC family transcriptional regulator [Bacilli bacterium]MBO7535817.1 AraC family transcriptional regulator [Bacilli bacterium]
MQVKDLADISFLKVLSDDATLDNEIKDLYTSDLLSWVMGHVHQEKVALLTILNTINAVAVATLLDMSAIIFCEGVIPTDDIIAKANEEGIAILASSVSSIATAREIIKHEG